jgi:hypothetical protein
MAALFCFSSPMVVLGEAGATLHRSFVVGVQRAASLTPLLPISENSLSVRLSGSRLYFVRFVLDREQFNLKNQCRIRPDGSSRCSSRSVG